jgi:hypothetical protein
MNFMPERNLHITASLRNQTQKPAIHVRRDTQWEISLRHCTTSWKVAGSIFDGLTGIFH